MFASLKHPSTHQLSIPHFHSHCFAPLSSAASAEADSCPSAPVPPASSPPASTHQPSPKRQRDPTPCAASSCTAGILEIPNYGRKRPDRSNPTQTRTDPTPKSSAAASFRPDKRFEAARFRLLSVLLEFGDEFPPFSPLFRPSQRPAPRLPPNSTRNLPSNSIPPMKSAPNSILPGSFAANSPPLDSSKS